MEEVIDISTNLEKCNNGHFAIFVKCQREYASEFLIGGWGVSPSGKSFRVVLCMRACVRSRGLVA